MTGLKTTAVRGGAAVLALAFCTGVASAQPTAKSYALDNGTRDLLWCSVVFYEESFWHEVGSPEEIYYNELSLELEDQAFAGMGALALTDDRAWELWEIHVDAAYGLYESDHAGFQTDLAACETRHGKGGANDTPPPRTGAASK